MTWLWPALAAFLVGWLVGFVCGLKHEERRIWKAIRDLHKKERPR